MARPRDSGLTCTLRTRTALLYRAASAACAREALQLPAHADIWCEEPADVWWTGYEVLQSCGHADEAQAALNAGVAWVHAGAAQCTDVADREAWLQGNPLHRALLRAGAFAS